MKQKSLQEQIATPPSLIDWIGRTDVGRMRSHNEDYIGHAEDLGLLVLADGMGGHNAGEVASRIAVETVIEMVSAAEPPFDYQGIDHTTGCSLVGLLLRNAVVRANRAIFEQAKLNPAQHGMGTTLVAVLLGGGRIHFAYVGDSRLYCYRRGILTRLTLDHTMRQEVMDRGLSDGQATPRNVITRALGVAPTVAIDVREKLALPEDLFLLCSDGLYEMVKEDAIAEILRQAHDHLAPAADTLIEQANRNGGKDNISVVLCRLHTEKPPRRSWLERLTRRNAAA